MKAPVYTPTVSVSREGESAGGLLRATVSGRVKDSSNTSQSLMLEADPNPGGQHLTLTGHLTLLPCSHDR